MEIIEIKDIGQEETKIFSSLTEHELKSCDDSGLIIVESPKVIKVAYECGYEGVSLLCEKKHIEGDAAGIIKDHPELKIYTGDRQILAQLTGYKLTRGVLCAMKRPKPADPTLICRNARRIAVMEGVCDTTNIGSIFRSAAALGIDGILLTPDSCDPFNRRSIRVSMGTVFKIPWAFTPDPVGLLKELGFITVALTLDVDSISISSPVLKETERLAMVLGTEGDGLSQRIISKCHYKAVIPMHKQVDSLNVGAAAAIAFWQLS